MYDVHIEVESLVYIYVYVGSRTIFFPVLRMALHCTLALRTAYRLTKKTQPFWRFHLHEEFEQQFVVSTGTHASVSCVCIFFDPHNPCFVFKIVSLKKISACEGRA